MCNANSIYEQAKDQYANIGVDTEDALKILDAIPVSMHCWQGDDIRGFEGGNGEDSGGLQSTGNYPGAAQNADELKQMIEKVLSQIPGKTRINLHAMYGDVNGVDRNQIEPKHFESWVEWAKTHSLALDFNPTLFAHPKSAQGLTLSHPDKAIRDFWIDHCIRSRKIAEYFTKELGSQSIANLWIADGFKDVPADMLTPRKRLVESLDAIFAEKMDVIDALESKLFGIGVESYTTGSHEFYMGYAIKNGLALTIDTGHFHPTEMVSVKISAISLFVEKILLHVSRPVRWDSDHVVMLDDELIALSREIIRGNLLDKVHIGTDFFDGSIDRVMAWTIGMRNMRKALLIALLDPYKELQKAEWEFDFTKRLVMTEELKAMPWSAVWNEYCERSNKPSIIKG